MIKQLTKIEKDCLKVFGCVIGVDEVNVCLAKGTKVLMADLTWKNIEDIKVGDKILTLSENSPAKSVHRSVQIATVLKTHFNGTRDVIKIQNQYFSVYATPDHKFYINNKWRPLGAFRKVSNAYIVKPTTGIYDMNQYKLGFLLGYIDGDGHVNKYSVDIWSRSSAAINDLQLICTDLSLQYTTHQYGKDFKLRILASS